MECWVGGFNLGMKEMQVYCANGNEPAARQIRFHASSGVSGHLHDTAAENDHHRDLLPKAGLQPGNDSYRVQNQRDFKNDVQSRDRLPSRKLSQASMSVVHDSNIYHSLPVSCTLG